MLVKNMGGASLLVVERPGAIRMQIKLILRPRLFATIDLFQKA